MHLQPKGNTNPHNRFHAPTTAAKDLLATGMYEEVPVQRVSVPFKPLVWRTAFVSGFNDPTQANLQFPPYIHASCPMCSKWQRNESDKGTAYETDFTSHAPYCTGKREPVPAEVKAQYLKLWDKYVNRRSNEKAALRDKRKQSVTLFPR